PVEGGTAYYLTVPSNAGIGYHITIDNAALAEGSMQGDVLTLYGKEASFQVMSVSKGSLAMQENSGAVSIIKSLPGQGTAQLGRALLQNEYKNVQLSQLLDSKRAFQTDEENSGLQAGTAQLRFDDT